MCPIVSNFINAGLNPVPSMCPNSVCLSQTIIATVCQQTTRPFVPKSWSVSKPLSFFVLLSRLSLDFYNSGILILSAICPSPLHDRAEALCVNPAFALISVPLANDLFHFLPFNGIKSNLRRSQLIQTSFIAWIGRGQKSWETNQGNRFKAGTKQIEINIVTHGVTHDTITTINLFVWLILV